MNGLRKYFLYFVRLKKLWGLGIKRFYLRIFFLFNNVKNFF